MFIREMWGKFTSLIFWNFPFKHVITSTNHQCGVTENLENTQKVYHEKNECLIGIWYGGFEIIKTGMDLSFITT